MNAPPEDLARFVAAQAPVWDTVMDELRAGRKRTHWMWFVFPQLRGLGRSALAHRFGIAGLDEARVYAAHPLLAGRLREAADALLTHPRLSAEAILGPVDAAKLRSSATLFRAAGDPALAGRMQAVLDRFFDGTPCPATVAALAGPVDGGSDPMPR